MAVMAAFLQREFDVVRVKNLFENDQVEEVGAERSFAERTLAEFYGAETIGVNTDSTRKNAPKTDEMYRDVLINLRPKGSNLICEVQLTLTGISVLRKSEQNIDMLARMKSAVELTDTFVFSKHGEARYGQATAARATVDCRTAASVVGKISSKTTTISTAVSDADVNLSIAPPDAEESEDLRRVTSKDGLLGTSRNPRGLMV
jgi:hypothetical protein